MDQDDIVNVPVRPIIFKSRKLTLPTPSNEQLAIVDAINEGHNVVVDSVFGSGKTTTILHVAQRCPDLNVLCFTYSKNLKEETRIKADKMKLSNIEVHSFHSFAVKYYNPKAFNDIVLVKKHNCSPVAQIPKYDLLIIDEIQDMTPDLYEFVSYIIPDLKPKQMLLIGDQYQCIFKFKNADNRYLTFGNQLFGRLSNGEWKELKLSVSFRVTNQIASFVNTQLVGYNRVVANKEGSPVNYIIMDPFKHMVNICDLVDNYLSRGYKPDDIFILAPTVKSNNPSYPLNVLENFLVYKKIPVIVQNNESDIKMDAAEMKGKIAFCTYHAVKGLERKICIVYGFDANYFEFYAKDESKEICPATIYVASSRSLEHLTLIHNHKSDYLPFLNNPMAMMNDPNIKVINLCKISVKELQDMTNRNKNKGVDVTTLVKFLPEKFMDSLIDRVSFRVEVPRSDVIKTNILVKMGDLVENVSAHYGTCIPMVKQFMSGSSTNGIREMFDFVRGGLVRLKYDRYVARLDKLENEVMMNVWNYPELMWFTNCHMMIHSGYINQFEQITNYEWVDSHGIQEGISRLNLYIDTDGDMFEVSSIRTLLGVDVRGRPDLVDVNNRILWEFKFVNEITKEHILQLVIYSWISGYTIEAGWQLFLFNIKNGEILDINKIIDIDGMVAELVNYKFYRDKSEVKDDAFLNTNLSVNSERRVIPVEDTRSGGSKSKFKSIPCEF